MIIDRYSSKNDATTCPEETVIILGATGRGVHDFITYWSTQPNTIVKAFTDSQQQQQQLSKSGERMLSEKMCNNQLNGNLYPNGVPIYSETELEQLIQQTHATTCAWAHSNVNCTVVQSLAGRANAAGCTFVQLPPSLTMVKSSKPVIAVCAAGHSNVGTSLITRSILAKYLSDKGVKVAVVRRPMHYDNDFLMQRCQRYETLDDMNKYNCTVEEREEYYRYIVKGILLFVGIDSPLILRGAEKEADIILWDGVNNELPCTYS
jgi:predicted GTPase